MTSCEPRGSAPGKPRGKADANLTAWAAKVPAASLFISVITILELGVQLVELNEAFACQALHVQRQLEIPDDKLNVNGGAIALGHPLGCTGAKLTPTALSELRRRRGRHAIVTMCIGGGQGAAGLFEAVA